MFGRSEKLADGSIRIGFVFKVDCNPPIATLDIRGSTFITATSSEELKELENQLSQNRVPPPILMATFSYVLPLLSLLARELGLPPPVPPPIAQTEHTTRREPTTGTGISYHV